MVRRLNRHRLTEQNYKLQSCEEPSLAVIILSLRVLKVRAKLLGSVRSQGSLPGEALTDRFAGPF